MIKRIDNMNIDKIKTIIDELSTLYSINFLDLKTVNIDVKLAKLSKRVLGLYSFKRKTRYFKITINERYNKLNDDNVIFCTIWHEFCHFLSQINYYKIGHDKNFQRYLSLFDLSGYLDTVDYGYKYNAECQNCGQKSGLYRKLNFENLCCSICKSDSIKVQEIK